MVWEEEEKRKKEYGICEACGERHVQWILKDSYKDRNTKDYRVCSTCLILLANTNLSSEQFKNLLSSGHTDAEFLLHGDFYDDDGNALQPRGER